MGVGTDIQGGDVMRTTAPIDITRNGYRYVRLPILEGYDELLIDQRIQFGAPCIRGTRMPAESVAMHHKAGDSVKVILSMFPTLTEAQVRACLDYVNVPVKAPQ